MVYYFSPGDDRFVLGIEWTCTGNPAKRVRLIYLLYEYTTLKVQIPLRWNNIQHFR